MDLRDGKEKWKFLKKFRSGVRSEDMKKDMKKWKSYYSPQWGHPKQ